MNEELIRPYTDDEIQQALFQMYPSKSPVLDGISPCFFQKYWGIVGADVCLAVHTFLTTSRIKFYIHSINT